jgi:RNA polymerase sigma factor FliA
MEPQTTSLASDNAAFVTHMHLVLTIVADFMRRVPRSVQREDLVAAGSMGLLHALRSNKHTCPEMLTAYARIRIRGSIIDELRRHDWSPRRRRTGATTALPGVVVKNGEPEPEKVGVVVIGFNDLPPTHSFKADGPSPLEEVEDKRSNNQVRAAVAKLPPRERRIVTMRFFEEVPSKAIASSLGLSEARVSQLLARATSQLKQLLTDESSELGLAA